MHDGQMLDGQMHDGQMHDTDVLIVGGGPAGTAAAIELARAGRQVTIIDKAIFPRDKCCGDGLTTGALRLLERLKLDPADVPSWRVTDAAWVRSPSGREVRFPMPENMGVFAAVSRRIDLDQALLNLARAAGVTVQEGHGFSRVVDNGFIDDSVTVAVDGLGQIRARYLIAADGMWSPVRKALGLAEEGYLGEWHAFRQYFENVTGPASERLYVWFEPDLLPGYAWSFPLPGNRANVGFGLLRGSEHLGKQMKQIWAEFPQRTHIAEALGPDATAETRHLAWPIPAHVDSAVLTAGRVLFVGDAARVTDPMTGEGIGQALLSGVLAAEAIVGAGALDPVGVAWAYEEAVKHHLLADHKMSIVLSKGLQREWSARGAVRIAGSTAWTRKNFARWLFEDEPRAVALTPSRWHRHFLNRQGAYAD
jgi:menaquinone-9 beta-reductase